MTVNSAQVERVHWADTAKGFVIALIVLSHGALFSAEAGYPQDALNRAIQFLTPAGMPFFFLISGMFSAKHLDSNWSVFWHRRLKPLLWALLLWIPIDWLLFRFFPNPRHPEHGRYVWQMVEAVLFPSSYLWFLWSLIAYSVIAKVVGRRLPLLWLAIAAGLALAMMGLTTWHLERYGLRSLANDYFLRGAISYFFYFYLGYIFRDTMLRIARLPAVPTAVGGFIAYSAMLWLSTKMTGVATGGLVRFAAVAIGIVGAMGVGRALALNSGTRAVFAWLGQLSLPIYLTHLLFIMPAINGLAAIDSDALRGWGNLLGILVSLLGMAGALAVTMLALRLKLRFFFYPPKLHLTERVRRRLGARRGDAGEAAAIGERARL